MAYLDNVADVITEIDGLVRKIDRDMEEQTDWSASKWNQEFGRKVGILWVKQMLAGVK